LLLEIAINAAGIADGQHGDYGVTGGTPVIVRVACPVPDRAAGAAALSGRIRVTVHRPSQVYDIYGRVEVEEEFACNWELNPKFRGALEDAGLRIVGLDEQEQTRITELPGHPFFIGTLFQPQLSSTEATPHPVIQAFCAAAQRFERRGHS
jgi:CTP synthase (UTP-ammonia lyase)